MNFRKGNVPNEGKYVCEHLKKGKEGLLESDCVWEEYDSMTMQNMKLELENEELKAKCDFLIGKKLLEKEGNEIEIKKQQSLVEKENEELKHKLEIQTKDYQRILQEQQADIDNLERNCDVYNEQMNDAVERTIELQHKLDEIRKMFESEKLEELNKYYYGDSYELDAHDLRKDILTILDKE